MTIESDADILIYDRLQCVIDIYQYKILLNDILLEEEYRVTMYTKLLSHHSLNYLPGTDSVKRLLINSSFLTSEAKLQLYSKFPRGSMSFSFSVVFHSRLNLSTHIIPIADQGLVSAAGLAM